MPEPDTAQENWDGDFAGTMQTVAQADKDSMTTFNDLSSLSPTERKVLQMLAEGHTAKSIAAQTGRSVSAINERLRQARRKAGVSSSRELARLVMAQQSCDEKIDLGTASSPWSAHGFRQPLIFGAIAMTVLNLALAAATLLPGAKPSTDAAVDRANMEIAADPAIKEATFMATSIPEQAQRIRTEPRDAQWADAAEGQLRARYQRLVRNGHLSIAYIRCATSVCEVRATILDKTEPQITNTMKDLQLSSHNTLGSHPLAELNAASFVSNKATVLYWKRATVAEQPKV